MPPKTNASHTDTGKPSRARPHPSSVRYSSESQATSANGSRSPVPPLLSTSVRSAPPLTPNNAATLQRMIGNQAVARQLQAPASNLYTPPPSIQRRSIQRQRDEQPTAEAGPNGGRLSSPLQGEIQRAQAGGQHLDAKTSAQMGSAFGKDFSAVKIHTDAKADLISRSLNANAFTLGNDIFFRKNHYSPKSSGGQHLLAHELTHVVQQSGPALPTVQTKLTVGAAHDQYEDEADRVAQQVTESISGSAPFARSANDKSQKDKSQKDTLQRQAVAPVQVRLKSAGKIARSYQERAEAFESSLGVYAFHHPKANAAAIAMSDRIRTYIEEKARDDKLTEEKIDQLWQKAGTSEEHIAGAVGDKVEDIKAVFTKGNLRERLTHIHNFMNVQFGGASRDQLGDLGKITGDSKELDRQFDYLQDSDGNSNNHYYDDVMHRSAPYQSALAEQHDIRSKSGTKSTTEKKVKDVGLESEGGLLSERELRHMVGNREDKNDKTKNDKTKNDQSKTDLQEQQLTWSEGARVWKMEKTHWWVQIVDALDTPLMAGPSAHTNAFMNIAKLFGIKDLASVRLAVIGHLIPIRSHSLVEILTAAAGHGLPFWTGPEMYRHIKPLTDKELRNQVGKGTFPDEFGSPKTGTGSDYGKLQDKYSEVMQLYNVNPAEADHAKRFKKLSELDKAALKHLNAKQKEKNKLKNNPDEMARLDQRIKSIEELRGQLKVKLDQAKKMLTLEQSRKRVQELQGSKEYNDKVFHGTHTGLLTGLAKSKGTLISAKELVDRGITQVSGEGDFFSNGVDRGPKEFISVGIGEFGLGTAVAYSQAAGTLPNYNIQVYKDEELALEIARLKEAIANYDESLVELDKETRDFKTKGQLQNLLARLEAEVKARTDLPKEHPRRQGKLGDDSNFPLLFEFTGEGLDIRDEGRYENREKLLMEAKTYNEELMGERMVYGGTIDLRPRIRRVYCPLDKIDEVKQKMISILEHENFEVLAIEAITELSRNTPIGGIRHETYAMQVDFEDVRKDTITGYAHAMKSKSKFSNVRDMAKKYGTVPDQKNEKDSNGPPKSGSEVKSTQNTDETKTSGNSPLVENGPPTKESADLKAKQKEGTEGGKNAIPPQVDSLTQTLTNDGLRLHKIDGNGNCLFAAIIHQLGLQGVVYKSAMHLRRALATYMLEAPLDFQQNVLAPIFQAENMTVKQAAVRIQTPGYWSGLVGDTAPQLLADLLERPLILYRPDGAKQTIAPSGANRHPALSLIYNGRDHYDSTAPGGLTGPIMSKIPEGNLPTEDPDTKPKTLDAPSTSTGNLDPLAGKTVTHSKAPSVPEKKEEKGSEALTSKGSSSIAKANQRDLTEQSAPLPKPKKGKPRLVLSGHGLLKVNTKPTQIKVPSKMSITFTGPIGSILDNPLANAVEQNKLLPEDIFVEVADMETGEVTEIEPTEIMKLYKIFGPRSVAGGEKTPNYTLTPPKSLAVSIANEVFTVAREHTLAEIFQILSKIYPKGVDVMWAACQDLPEVDRRFQIKVMNVKDRFVPTGHFKRATTSGANRKETIKMVQKMIKEFKSL